MSYNCFPSSQPTPVQPFPKEPQRLYTNGNFGIKKQSRNKTLPVAISDLPPDLSASEWEYVNRTAQNWNVIENASEIRVQEGFGVETVPGNSYQLLDDVLANHKGTNETFRRMVLGFLQNHPQSPIGSGSMWNDWNRLVQKGMQGTNTPEKDWVAPSGNWEQYNPLTVIWAYPTFATRQSGNTKNADTTNPCTRMLLKKGINPITEAMVWLETVHRRINTSVTKCKSSPLAVIHPREAELHIEFVKRQVSRMNSRVVLLPGVHARENFKKNLKLRAILKVQLPGASPDQPIHVWVDASPATFEVRRVAVLCEHPCALYFPGYRGMGQHMDSAIRVATELSGLRIELNDRYFEWTEKRLADARSGPSSNPWQIRTGTNPIMILCKMLKSELSGEGPIIAYSDINPRFKELFCRWTEQHDSSEEEMRKVLLPLCPASHVSLVKGLHVMCCAKGSETQAAGGYQNLVKARATLAAAGHPHLKKAGEKGRETQAANLAKAVAEGHVTVAAKQAAEFQRRLADANADRQKIYWICEECQKAYDVWAYYKIHMRAQHPDLWQYGQDRGLNTPEIRRYRPTT